MVSKGRGDKKMAATAKVLTLPKAKMESMAEKVMLLKLSFGHFGNSKRIPSGSIEVDADKKMVKANKVLLDSPELKEIWKRDGELKAKIQSLCLPFPYTSFYAVPIPSVDEAYKMCEEYEKEREETLVPAFLKAYPKLCENAEKRLRGIHNSTDYPTLKNVAKEFTFEYNFLTLGVPGQLKEIKAEIFKKEKEKAAEVWKEFGQEAQTVLRTTLAGMVGKLKDKLEPGQDGKQKRIHTTTVEKMNEFLNTFNVRNVTDDVELKKEVDRLKGLLSGVSVEALRTTDTLRDKLKTEMAEVEKNLTNMIEIRGRKFRDE